MSKWIRRAGRLAAGAALLASGVGCRAMLHPAPPTAPLVTVVVTNYDYYDVAVYAVPGQGTPGLRIATVNGLSSRTIRVRRDMLEMGAQLTLQVRALGTAFSWTSPAVTIDSDDVARLDVYSDPDGDLHRSSLYARAM